MSGYIGNIPVPQATQTRQSFTATASQTTFNTAGYSVGYVDVFLNGVKLAPADYTATNGSDIVLAVGAASGDILEIVAYEIFQVVDQDFTGDFTVDGTTFVVDSTNNRVGVGTASPSVPLEITHGSTSVGLYTRGSYNYQAKFESTDAEAAIVIEDSNSTNDGNRIGVITDDMTFITANAERMRIDSSGNVGIGTSSPSETLDVSGNIRALGANSRVMFGPDGFEAGIKYATDASLQIASRSGENITFTNGNDGTERMRIDSSGNLLVDTTSTTIVGSGGLAAKPQGSGVRLDISNSGGAAMLIDRRTNDGDIITLYKDGSGMGSIGVADGDNLVISSTATDHGGLKFNNTAMAAYVNGASSDGTMSIGTSVVRFSDLYLSGGVYLGGTGAANKLDDYEEGTWTPAITSTGTVGTWTPSYNTGRYVKVGNLVHVMLLVGGTYTSGTGSIVVTGFPFFANGGGQTLSINEYRYINLGSYTSVSGMEFTANGTNAYPYKVGSSISEASVTTSDWGSSGTSIIWASGTYSTT